ncbi:Hypothetical predicted protein [Paramuricea clavata]|uniref:Uncharacterized protein n=1 Tax=Paramuricea clavata TaxID=317549 RepID=A0A6S7LL28_PARCT|nr:Hypothetical predicted protein [Paramuricea clavata]
MAKANLTFWLVFLPFVLYYDFTYAHVNFNFVLLQDYRKYIDTMLKVRPCSQDYNLLGLVKIFQDYSFWDSEMKIATNGANYLTSMWRFKDEKGRSLIENEEAIYTLAKTIAMSSDRIFGSAVCFDENKFQVKRQFCPYAFKNSRRNRVIIVRDLGRFNDYLTNSIWTTLEHRSFNISNFTWWRVGKTFPSKATQLKQSTAYFDTNFDNLATKKRINVSGNGKYFNITSNYIPINYGKWTSPYYDCVGGKTWMITYLVPFYDETDTFL